MAYNQFAVLFMWFSLGSAMNFSFLQNDFVMTYGRGEVISYDPKYFSSVATKTYKFNRTQAVINVTFTVQKNLRHPFKLEIQAYIFASNEYRYFPVRFSYNFCETLRNDDFGIRTALMKCGNFSGAGCPYRKGTYASQFYLDGNKYPPHVPGGSYMLGIKRFEGEKEVLFMQGYGTIKYKNFWEH